MQSPDGRPIYLDLIRIKLPMPGIISIMHRVFGVMLSFSIPFFSYLFALSLSSEAGYNQALSYLDSMFLVPVYLMLLWGFIHHLFAGIRYLLIDIEVGVEREVSYNSSYVVLIAALIVSLIIALGVWL
jgi:succinate dehydrogenase / fumarate reductase cytochrome b subunit